MPAAVAPHKKDQQTAPAEDRLEMLKLAAGGNEAFRVSELELQRGGVSYTVDTLEAVQAAQPDAELYLLIGADTLADLPNWRNPIRVCELALPTVVARPGFGPLAYEPLAAFVEPGRLARIRELRVEMPLIELSSREIRARIAAGKSIRYQTPRAVEKYVETAGLYRI
ncbi:MAG: nicotinate (nicotinamide) nucleotide adenylyltransferase [Pirellulales bacterium]